MNNYYAVAYYLDIFLRYYIKQTIMSKIEHFRIIAAILLITATFSIAGLIQGLEILAFMFLGIAGLYFSFFFIKYVYEQKGYPLNNVEDNIEE